MSEKDSKLDWKILHKDMTADGLKLSFRSTASTPFPKTNIPQHSLIIIGHLPSQSATDW